MSAYEKALSVSMEEIEFELRCVQWVPWADFLLNPRRLRGSDFLMRWSQGQWSEERLLEAFDGREDFFAIPYGPSSVAPSEPREVELYFERLDAAGLSDMKRPDLLAFEREHEPAVMELVQAAGGKSELAFTPDDDLEELLSYAFMGIECENSLWKAQQMPSYGEDLRPMKRLEGRPGLPKNAVVPTVILKEEDREPLRTWQDGSGIPIHIWHVFYERAYGIAFSEADRLITAGLIEATEQTFQAPAGATSSKRIYKIYYHHAYSVGVANAEPALEAKVIVDKNGHVLPYVTFTGGSVQLAQDAIDVLTREAHRR
jgi:hypothetical protein